MALDFTIFIVKIMIDPHYEPYPEQGSEVIVLCGLPGMGKDSYIRQYCADMPVVKFRCITSAA